MNKELTVQAEVNKHTKEGLIESLKREKRCRKRGKWLDLVTKEDNST